MEYLSYRRANRVVCWCTGWSRVLLDMFKQCGMLTYCMMQSPAWHVPAVWCADWLDGAKSCLTCSSSVVCWCTGWSTVLTCSSSVVCWLTAWCKVLLDMFQQCGVLMHWVKHSPDMFQQCGVLTHCMVQSPAWHVPAVWCADSLHDAKSCLTYFSSVVCWLTAWYKVLLDMFQQCGVLTHWMVLCFSSWLCETVVPSEW